MTLLPLSLMFLLAAVLAIGLLAIDLMCRPRTAGHHHLLPRTPRRWRPSR